jgi:hypothetical protein
MNQSDKNVVFKGIENLRNDVDHHGRSSLGEALRSYHSNREHLIAAVETFVNENGESDMSTLAVQVMCLIRAADRVAGQAKIQFAEKTLSAEGVPASIESVRIVDPKKPKPVRSIPIRK